MSRIKDLRNSPTNCINLVDFITTILPEDINQPKYVETLLRIIKSNNTLSEFNDVFGSIKPDNGFNDKINDFPLHIKYFFYVLNQSFEDDKEYGDSKNMFIEFCRDNEKNYVENTDLTQYDTFLDVREALVKSKKKRLEKLLEKQTYVVYEDDTWMIIRPLTFLSSLKYGANTKWCTIEKKKPSHFVKKRDQGILIYCINKNSSYKCAFECYDTSYNTTITVWNDKSVEIDTLETNLPFEIIKIVFDEIKNSPYRSNKSLMDQEMVKNDYEYIQSLDSNDKELNYVDVQIPF